MCACRVSTHELDVCHNYLNASFSCVNLVLIIILFQRSFEQEGLHVEPLAFDQISTICSDAHMRTKNTSLLAHHDHPQMDHLDNVARTYVCKYAKKCIWPCGHLLKYTIYLKTSSVIIFVYVHNFINFISIVIYLEVDDLCHLLSVACFRTAVRILM